MMTMDWILCLKAKEKKEGRLYSLVLQQRVIGLPSNIFQPLKKRKKVN